MPDSAWPTVIALVGPNGSGKSPIARLLGLTNARVGDQRYRGRLVVDEATGEIVLPLVNADEIAKHIHNSRPDLGWYDCNVEAAREAARMRGALSEALLDFGFETVGSHHSKVEALAGYKAMGYLVTVLFVTTESADINVRRVEQRRCNGGHDVPEDKIRARHGRNMAFFPDYLAVADIMAVYDNSEDHVADDGEGPKLLLVKKGDETRITEQGRCVLWLVDALAGNL